GPIIDATAKRLAAQFFNRFGEMVTAQAPAAEAVSVAPNAQPIQTAVAEIAEAKVSSSRISSAWLLALAVGAIGGFLVGRAQNNWFSIGLLVLVVAVGAFELGRRLSRVER